MMDVGAANADYCMGLKNIYGRIQDKEYWWWWWSITKGFGRM
jgi:hypothetical protein